MSLLNTNPVNPSKRKKVAIVIANPTTSSTTSWPVGFWWSELTHPYFAFIEAGYEVTIFSPNGGACKADAMSDPNDASGYSKSDLISQGFIHTQELKEQIDNTQPITALEINKYDALIVAGGQAPMFNFANATALHNKFVEFYTSGKVVAALCHGVAILKYAKLPNGEYLATGKTVTGFANI